MIQKNRFAGIMVPLLTPLNEGEQLIENDLERHINSLLAKGVHGFLVPSASGEFANLSTQTKQSLLHLAIETVKGRVPVTALVGECGTKETMGNIRHAQEAGADAVMVQPPFYYPVGQQELQTHFLTLADQSELPLWLYHQPGDTKLQIGPDLVSTLSEHPNIVGIKISAGKDLYYYQNVFRLLKDREEFRILIGEDHFLLPGFAIGGHGAVAFLANIIPEEIAALWDAVKRNALADARTIQGKIMDCYELVILNTAGSPQSIAKFILEKKGIFSTHHCSAPFQQLENSVKQNLNREIVKLNLF